MMSSTKNRLAPNSLRRGSINSDVQQQAKGRANASVGTGTMLVYSIYAKLPRMNISRVEMFFLKLMLRLWLLIKAADSPMSNVSRKRALRIHSGQLPVAYRCMSEKLYNIR